MNWLIRTLGSSIGKKLMMAATGLCLIGFITTHLAGNLTIYGGRDALNAYAARLHALGPLVTLAELGLLLLALVHIATGLFLFYQNWTARPNRYAVNKTAGGRTLSSQTMPYTGLIIFSFVIVHLLDFHFVDKTHITIYQIVARTFSNPVYVFFYAAVMVVLAVHVRHGLWSAFQSLGANHPKYMPPLMVFSVLFALAIGIGFGFIPLYLLFQA